MTTTDIREREQAPAAGVLAPAAVTGWSVLSSIGNGADAFTEAVAEGRSGACDASGMFDLPLPSPTACALPDFQAKDFIGRKGTTFLDRSTALGLVGCHLTLQDASLVVDDGNRDRVGVILGTTTGGVNAIVDYCRDTLEQDPPYMVKPLLFPNTVMNSTAGQVGIRLGLRGANSTIAGGQLASLNALRYGIGVLRNGYADALVVGAYEEFTPQTAWIDHNSGGDRPGRVPLGEGAVGFMVEDAARVRAEGRVPDAEILTVETGTGLPLEQGPELARLLTATIERALARSGVRADEVWAVASGENGRGDLDAVEDRSIRDALGADAARIRIKTQVGECHAAAGGLQLAALLARHRNHPELDGRASIVTSVSDEGAVAVAVLRGWSRDGGDHR